MIPSSPSASPRCTRHALLTGATLAACLIGSLPAGAATLEERLAALEQKVSALSQENTVLKQKLGHDNPAKPAAATVVAQGKELKLALGGFLHFNAEAGDAADQRFPENDRFLLRRMRLGAKGSFSDVFDFSLQFDLGANSLGSISSFRAQAADIFVVWKAHPAANVTVGQFKTPFGYEFLVPDVRTVSVERSLAADVLTLGRQVGAMVGGGFLNQKLTYAAAITNGNGANNSFNDNNEFTYVGRIAGTAFANDKVKLTLGTNVFTGKDKGGFIGRRTGQGVDAQITFAGAEITGELLRTHFNRELGNDFDADGWSLQGAYFLVPNRWQAVARFESYDPSSLVGADHTDLTTLGVNYLFKGDDLKLSVNYLIGNPPGADGHQGRLLARLQVIY